MTAAPDLDPYLLPLPTPASPVVLPHLASPMHAHLNGRYANPVWPLAPLTGTPAPGSCRIQLADTGPPRSSDEMRLAAWNLINGQLRPTFLRGHGARMRAASAWTEIHGTVADWRQLAEWLEEQGNPQPRGLRRRVLHDYGQHLRDAATAGTASRRRPWLR